MAESIPGVRDSDKGFQVPPLMTALLHSALTAGVWIRGSAYFQAWSSAGAWSGPRLMDT